MDKEFTLEELKEMLIWSERGAGNAEDDDEYERMMVIMYKIKDKILQIKP